jgi:hypothetical protein
MWRYLSRKDAAPRIAGISHRVVIIIQKQKDFVIDVGPGHLSASTRSYADGSGIGIDVVGAVEIDRIDVAAPNKLLQVDNL